MMPNFCHFRFEQTNFIWPPFLNDNPTEDYKSNYIDSPNTPLYPFGHGLSYTTFEYSEIKLSNNKVRESEILKVSSIITNTGEYDGHEVVQLYIHDKVASITRPVKELKDFKKIFLRKGESKTVTFEINSDDLKFYNNGKLMIIFRGDGLSFEEFKRKVCELTSLTKKSFETLSNQIHKGFGSITDGMSTPRVKPNTTDDPMEIA